MKILKFYETSGTLKLRLDTLEDLWAVQRIIFENDYVKSESMRRFRGNENDTGELKEVVIKLKVEKTELDKAANHLRIIGKITEGKPLEYIKLNSYHTLSIAPGDVIEITKEEWHDYLVQVIKNAVKDSRRPRLGIILADEEKALVAYLYGYGIEFKKEVYSHLSKRMGQKEFTEQQNKYFEELLGIARNMEMDVVVIAGPGFTKDDIKKYAEEKGMMKKMDKRVFFFKASTVERSGVYELIGGREVEQLLEGDRIRREFRLMGEFLEGLGHGRSHSGINDVAEALKSYDAEIVLVNDSVLGRKEIKEVLAEAEKGKIKIEIFNANDEAGMQLHSFNDIACM